MKFYKVRWKSNIIKQPNCFFLEDRDWNDWNYYTTYFLYYCNEENDLVDIGEVKILKKDCMKTPLENEFRSLEEDFCSLGQSREYYKNLRDLGFDIYNSVFKALKDCSINPKIKEEFEELDGFNISLLREGIASLLLYTSSNIIESKPENLNNSEYIYKTLLPGASNEHKIDFLFKKESILPHRVFVLVGKNGVGKTKVLENLIFDLINNNEEAFENKKMPEYNQILLFSYGVYDNFEKIKELEELGDIYLLGLINENEFLEEIKFNLNKIYALKREEYLLKILEELMQNKELAFRILNNIDQIEKMSSGQKMIMQLVIELISNIKEETLIIIDEPENHLHPNILGKSMNFIRKILEDYNSYVVMSTHSPLILQQVMSKSIRVIKRLPANTPMISKLDIECFGENLTEITNKVFEVSEVEDSYKTILKKLSIEKSYDDILNLFGNKLSFNCKVYLKSLYESDYYEKCK